LDPDSPLREDCGEIIRETERISAIVSNLLTFARHDKQSHSPARIADIVESTMTLIRTVLRHDQIMLEVEVPEDLPKVKCRSQQIQQVLMNLVTNGRDALNAKYAGYHENKVLRIACNLFEDEEGHWIRTMVEDHGTGIDEATVQRIYEPFFTTKSRDQGTGLGLSISHGIVKDHGGRLAVETVPGELTRFHLDLKVNNDWQAIDSIAATKQDQNA
jgi:C4-dicarboxylate-specific signal transduction histidine kinase